MSKTFVHQILKNVDMCWLFIYFRQKGILHERDANILLRFYEEQRNLHVKASW